MGQISMLEYLNDPQLVANFQKFFGVITPDTPTTATTNNQTLRRSPRLNTNDKSTTTDGGGEADKDFEFDVVSYNENKSVLRAKAKGESSHTRNSSSSSSTSGISSLEESVEDERRMESIITNKFFYYLFHFGTALGDEVFYAFWFSFWFWNVDGAVGRRVVLLWGCLMYIGQGLKDIIRWPRPRCPPVVRLEKKWEMEYGMPSTHAVVGAAVPFSTLFFTASRYQYPIWIGATGSIIWCALVCLSRLYLGMHSVLDIVAGLGLVAVLFVPVLPLVDWLDPIIIQSEYGGLALFLVGVFLCFCTPGGDRWTPARGDTFVILGSCTGLIMGAWVNYQTGVIRGPPMSPPYPVIWPSYSMLGQSLLRVVIGLCMIVAARASVKAILHTFFHRFLKISKLKSMNDASRSEVFAELSQKFLSYVIIGFNIVYLSPAVFRFLGIERPTFHTEV